MTTFTLPFDNMADRHPGLIASVAAYFLDAARVCLDKHHQPPQEFILVNEQETCIMRVAWQQTDQRTRAAFNNTDDAKRDGAYACALAAVECTRGWVAIGRAETKTGADYYIAPVGVTLDDLEGAFRLEVSGTDLDPSGVKQRLREKLQQTQDGKSNVPALAAVIGFRARLMMIRTAGLT